MIDDNTWEFWENNYRQKGRLYGGVPRPLPPLPAGSRVLELGCGNGKSLSYMVCCGWNLTAIDFSQRAVFLARAVAQQSPSADIAVADARAMPFYDDSFDAVAAFHILGHSTAAGRDEIAREICRVIKPGGRVLFSGFSPRDFRYGTGRETEPGTFSRDNGILTHYFTEAEVACLFSELTAESLQKNEWALRVRGKDYTRSEIAAVFTKRPLP